ncbi:MAG: hypothetical protein KDD52_04910 [Bdellovibrionales bacterium]|nr:hypothetical protein [Bdellovibrionales bacterium]
MTYIFKQKLWAASLGLCVALGIQACAKDESNLGRAEKILNSSADLILKEYEMEPISCNGSGSDYSGDLTIETHDILRKCRGTHTDSKPNEVLSCTQVDSKFSCANQHLQISGCISDEGRFKLESNNQIVQLAMTVAGGDKTTHKSIMVGDIDGEGKILYGVVGEMSKKKKGCYAELSVEYHLKPKQQ